ncbi:MAG: MFS transporter [Gemmatimonadales bacterium]
MSTSGFRQYFSGLSRNTFLLAWSSLFADISTEMLYPILPIFLTQVLRASGSVVGLVDGVAQAAQNIVQGFSGALSDRLQRRKSIALAGYLLAAISKPLMGLSATWQALFAARFSDRVGAGIRSAPRDALIAASVSDADRGKAFGLEGMGDNLGAFLGPLVALALLYALHVRLRTVFYLAVVPGLLALVMVAWVTERKTSMTAKSRLDFRARNFPKPYWTYLLVIALFGIGNSSNAFLLLRTRDIGASLATTILIYAAFNLIAALISYPAGALSDRWGRKHVLLAAFVVFLVAYLGFALTRSVLLIGVFFALYGLYEGIFRAVGKSFAADFVPAELRASGIGWFSTTVGLMQLLASVVAGILWDKVGHEAVFFYGAAFALVGITALATLVHRNS